MTSCKHLWAQSTLKAFESEQYLMADAICYGLNQILCEAKYSDVNLECVVILPPCYWQLFNVVDSGLMIDSLTSKFVPKTFNFYDIILVSANIQKSHWMGYAIFHKIYEIFELNSKASISLDQPITILQCIYYDIELDIVWIRC